MARRRRDQRAVEFQRRRRHRLESRILESENDLSKTVIAVTAMNSAVVLAAMFGLAEPLGR